MRCEQFRSFNKPKVINESPVSVLFKLEDGRYLKIIAKDFLDHYLRNGISVEDKILASENIKDIPELVLPSTAVYIGERFCGYTMKKGRGLAYPQYLSSLNYNEFVDLERMTNIYLNVENMVIKGWEQDLVFPDLFNGHNVFIDEDQKIQLIDFDGVQYKDYIADSVSTLILNSSSGKKYRKGLLWTPELDKKSLTYLYFSMVLGVSLSSVGSIRFGRNKAIKGLLDSVGLDDDAIYDKVCATLSDNQKGFLLRDDVCRITDNYKLVLRESNGFYRKVLSRK